MSGNNNRQNHTVHLKWPISRRRFGDETTARTEKKKAHNFFPPHAVLYKYSPGCVRHGWGRVLDSRKTSGDVWMVARRHLSFTNSCVASVSSGLRRVGPLSAQRVHFSCTCFSCIYYYWGIGILTVQYVHSHWESYVISCSKGMCPTNSAVQWLRPDHTHARQIQII